MNHSRFDDLVVTLSTASNRRTLIQGAAALGAAVVGGTVLPDAAAAKRLCRKDGTRCKKGKKCRARYCLKTPFTIEARWSNADSDHDALLFVPNEKGSSDPAPYVFFDCVPAFSDCENEVYPFTCVSQDAQGPGDEIMTVRRLLPGAYEYWIKLDKQSPRGDLDVILRNANGRVIRSWSSPANPDAANQLGWHVFNINGAARSISPVDKLTDLSIDPLPGAAHDPNTNVCPGLP
jgi:hypothetical protein